MLPEYDCMIETRRSVLSVLMQILDYLRLRMCICWCVTEISQEISAERKTCCAFARLLCLNLKLLAVFKKKKTFNMPVSEMCLSTFSSRHTLSAYPSNRFTIGITYMRRQVCFFCTSLVNGELSKKITLGFQAHSQKLRKASIYMSACLFVRIEQLGFQQTDFHGI